MKDRYIVVAPVTSKGKWKICVQRVGDDTRYLEIAEAGTQVHADMIKVALTLHVRYPEVAPVNSEKPSTKPKVRAA